MKKLLISFVAMLSASFMFIHNPGYAEEVHSVVQTNVTVETEKKLADVDVSNLSVGETKTITSQVNGEELTISVKKIKSANSGYSGFRSWNYNYSLGSGDGTYEVNVYRLHAQAGFSVDVSRGMIWNAYDPHYSSIFGISSANLVHENSWQATYYLNFSAAIPWINGPSWSGAVRAKIGSSNTLEVWTQ
jgi:hypothetical protein